jgi:hypothetical protein
MEQNLGVLDDFVKGRAEANSKLQRDRTWNWFTDDFYSRFSKDNALLVICTRWHVDDLLGRLMQKFPEMRVVSFQAIAEKDERVRRKGEALFPSLKPLGMLLVAMFGSTLVPGLKDSWRSAVTGRWVYARIVSTLVLKRYIG